MKKAIVMYDDMVKEGVSNEKFRAKTGWPRGFMKRYDLSLRRKLSVAQKDPDKLIDKLVSSALHICRFASKHSHYAVDTMPSSGQTWFLLQLWTTQIKKLTVKTTGHEKTRVSVCLKPCFYSFIY